MGDGPRSRLSADALRVLAVAHAGWEPRDSYSQVDEADLVLAGVVSFADQVLPDVGEVLAQLKRDGVTVKILTGDTDLVARHVSSERQCGRRVPSPSPAVGHARDSRLHVIIGPISSIFDFLTLFSYCSVTFTPANACFHTVWFVESLATQTLVLFVIHTLGNPFRRYKQVPW